MQIDEILPEICKESCHPLQGGFWVRWQESNIQIGTTNWPDELLQLKDKKHHKCKVNEKTKIYIE